MVNNCRFYWKINDEIQRHDKTRSTQNLVISLVGLGYKFSIHNVITRTVNDSFSINAADGAEWYFDFGWLQRGDERKMSSDVIAMLTDHWLIQYGFSSLYFFSDVPYYIIMRHTDGIIKPSGNADGARLFARMDFGIRHSWPERISLYLDTVWYTTVV